MSARVIILSPLDLKPGTVNADGRVVAKVEIHYTDTTMVAGVDYQDGTSGAFMWPLGNGWKVPS